MTKAIENPSDTESIDESDQLSQDGSERQKEANQQKTQVPEQVSEEEYWNRWINWGREENETTTPEKQQVPNDLTPELHSSTSSVVQAPSAHQQPVQIPCQISKPGSNLSGKSTSNLLNIPEKTLVDESIKNSIQGQMSGGNAPLAISLTTQKGAEMQLSQPAFHPQKVQQPVVSQQPVVQKPIQQQHEKPRPVSIELQKVDFPPPSTTTALGTATTTSEVTRPRASPAPENLKVSAPAPIAPTTTTANTSASSVVTRRSTETITMSEENRRSRIMQDVASTLPSPGASLCGSNSTSASPTTTAQTYVKDLSVVARVKLSQAQPTMPPKNTSEPILSPEVLQPTPLPSAASAPKPVSQPIPAHRPLENPSPPVFQTRLAEKKQANPLVQSFKVPPLNITKSGMYTYLNSYPNYGNGYQPYGYGMNFNPCHSGIQGYNTYASGMGPLALTNQTVNSSPEIVLSENRFSGSAQPQDESAINQFLESQHCQAAFCMNPAQTASVLFPYAPSSAYNNLSGSEKCDALIAECKKNTKLANKIIDLVKTYFLLLDVKGDYQQEIQSRQKDLESIIQFLRQ
ncbi:Protein CBG01893 [Caenorhabditis briggsae]|uniref:Protein CBG01893 n=2 Tax=Caenorhabditis briggsae TaxID=6238 RepID=A8WRI5_CAEBR|nr:Protein CBG01893 [Caenorhabditis briggsae]ULT80352.1 hypothetical protein L3Y34_010729 [Caenorhabditis briggsae]CAP23093.2 Protein CBG01893 [Caenorhabditis briggsae]